MPLWLRLQAGDMVKGYQVTIKLCEKRWQYLKRRKKRNIDGKPADKFGVIDDYRMDAKYCAGQATRLKDSLQGRLPPEEQEKGPWQEIPWDPRRMVHWAFQPLYEDAPQKPDLEVVPPKQLRLHEALAEFSPRERQVLIYCIGACWYPEDAAKKLDLPVHVVKHILRKAKSKFRSGSEGF